MSDPYLSVLRYHGRGEDRYLDVTSSILRSYWSGRDKEGNPKVGPIWEIMPLLSFFLLLLSGVVAVEGGEGLGHYVDGI